MSGYDQTVDFTLYEILSLLWQSDVWLTVPDIAKSIGRGPGAVRRRIKPLAGFRLILKRAKRGTSGVTGGAGQFEYFMRYTDRIRGDFRGKSKLTAMQKEMGRRE